MKEAFRILELKHFEISIVVNALNELRNKLIRDNQDTHDIDYVLLKVLDAPEKKRFFARER